MVPITGGIVERRGPAAELDEAVTSRELRCVSGAAGIGKTTVIRAVLESRPHLSVRGELLASVATAALHLGEVFDGEPFGDSPAAIARALYRRLPQCVESLDALSFENLHLADASIRDVLLELLYKLRLPCAVLVESRNPIVLVQHLSHRVRQHAIERMSEQESAALCQRLGGELADVPEALRGHPQLMVIYLSVGATRVEDWLAALVAGLPQQATVALRRLCIAATPTQRRWAEGALDESIRDPLAAVVDSDLRVTSAVREFVAASLEPGDREELERGLLSFLLEHRRLDQTDLRTALELAERPWADSARQTLIHSHGDRVLGLFSPSRVAELERLGARLRASSDPTERGLGHICRLRATLLSGLREQPRDLVDGVRELSPDPDAAVLWAKCNLVLGPHRRHSFDELAADLPSAARAELADAFEAFDAWVRGDAPLPSRPEDADFLHATRAWQDGKLGAIDSASLGLAPLPSPPATSSLPAPYLADYLPYAFAAIRGRDLDAVPLANHVIALVDGLRRLRPFASIGLGATALAQHCLLRDKPDAARQLTDALRDSAPVFAIEAKMVEALASATDLDAIAGALDAAAGTPSPLTTPYYAVLATRIALRADLQLDDLVERLRALASLPSLGGRPSLIIDECTRVLSEKARGLLGRLLIDAEDLEHPIRRQVLRSSTRAHSRPHSVLGDDVAVNAARLHVERFWFDPLDISALAESLGLRGDLLSRRFKRVVGVSPKKYHQRIRIAHASRLLIETDWNIAAVADECGYYDPSHFSREFKREKGVTPKAFRERR